LCIEFFLIHQNTKGYNAKADEKVIVGDVIDTSAQALNIPP
jgi:hypothetical protein